MTIFPPNLSTSEPGMKRLILAAVLSFATLTSAQAATYSVTTTAGQEAAITDARSRYNASLPQVCDAQGQNCSTPGTVITNGAYLLQVITAAVTSWNAVSVRPQLSVSDKAAAITVLQADVARADANSAAAQALLDKINAAQ